MISVAAARLPVPSSRCRTARRLDAGEDHRGLGPGQGAVRLRCVGGYHVELAARTAVTGTLLVIDQFQGLRPHWGESAGERALRLDLRHARACAWRSASRQFAGYSRGAPQASASVRGHHPRPARSRCPAPRICWLIQDPPAPGTQSTVRAADLCDRRPDFGPLSCSLRMTVLRTGRIGQGARSSAASGASSSVRYDWRCLPRPVTAGNQIICSSSTSTGAVANGAVPALADLRGHELLVRC